MAKILLIEDDNSLRTAYNMILTANKFEVVTATDGRDGLAKLKKFKPTLILLDLLMPVMDGLEFLKKYNPLEKGRPDILLLTNMPSSQEVDQCLKLGVKQVAIKSSLTPSGLLELVKCNLQDK